MQTIHDAPRLRWQLLLILIIESTCAVFAQEKPDFRHPDSLKVYCSLDTAYVTDLFQAQFTKIIDPAANTNIGNYAAIETDDATLTLGASNRFKNGSVLALKVSGGVDEGVASIWANRKLNSKFSADVQYHFMKRTGIIEADGDSCDAMKARMLKMRTDYAVKWHDIDRRMDVVLISREIDKQNAQLRALIRDTASVHEKVRSLGKIKRPAPGATPERTALLQDSLGGVVARLLGKDSVEFSPRKVAIERLFTEVIPNAKSFLVAKAADIVLDIERTRLAVRSKQVELREVKSQDPGAMRSVLYNGYVAKRDDMLGSLGVMGMDLSWWSIGYGINASKFKLFNDSAMFQDQITKSSYGSHELRVQLSRYNRFYLKGNKTDKGCLKWVKNYFISTGVAVGLEDNRGDLDEVTLEDRTVRGPDSLSRAEVSEYKALKGTYEKNLGSVRVFMDAYWFIMRNKSHAVHLFPSYRAKENTTPTLDVGVGFLLGYVKKDSPANAVNFEVFVLFNDLANGASATSNAAGRSDLGIRVTFPFNFPQRTP